MKVIENGKYKGEFTIECVACGCKYQVTGPIEFIFSEKFDEDTVYANDKVIYTSHSASTKCPQCLYVQKYEED